MSVRIAWPSRREPDIEKRFDLGGYAGSPGYMFPSVNATGSSLILDRAMESYSGSEIAYRCVQIKVTAMAALDLAIEKQVSDENGKPGLDLDKEAPLAKLFNKSTGSVYSTTALKRIAYEQMELSGQAFVYTARASDDPASEITAIAPIMANVTAVTFQTMDARTDMLLPQVAGYQVQTPRGVLGLASHDVLWLRYPHPTIPFMAVAPWRAAQWAADLDQKARQWQAAEFANGAKPTGVISLGNITEEQAARVKAQFESQHSGTANAGKHLFLYGETKAEYSRIGRTGEEMGYLASHAANAQDISHAFGVPIDLIIGQATYDNRHSAWVSLWTDTLTPALELIEGDIDRQLLPDTEERAVFDRSTVAALQENVDAVQLRTTASWQADGMTLAEYRTVIGLEPLGDERDDMLFTELQTSIKPAPQPPGGAPPDEGDQPSEGDGKDNALPDGEDAAAEGDGKDGKPADKGKRIETRSQVGTPMDAYHRALDKHEIRIQRAMARLGEKQQRVVLRKLGKLTERIAKGHEVRVSSQDVYDETYWTDQTTEALEGPVDDAWTDGAATTAALLGVSWALVEAKVATAAAGRIATVAAQVTQTTAKRVEKAINDQVEGDIEERVSGVFTALIPEDDEDLVSVENDGEDAPGWRAAGIARNEGVAGWIGGSLLAARGDDLVTYMTWVAQPDCCPLCEGLNETRVAIDDNFFSSGAGVPPRHVNCRCGISYTKADGSDAFEEVA